MTTTTVCMKSVAATSSVRRIQKERKCVYARFLCSLLLRRYCDFIVPRHIQTMYENERKIHCINITTRGKRIYLNMNEEKSPQRQIDSLCAKLCI